MLLMWEFLVFKDWSAIAMIDLLKFIVMIFFVGAVFFSCIIGGYFLWERTTVHFVKEQCKNCEWKND